MLAKGYSRKAIMKKGNIFNPVEHSGQDELIIALLEREGSGLSKSYQTAGEVIRTSGMTRTVMNGCCLCTARLS